MERKQRVVWKRMAKDEIQSNESRKPFRRKGEKEFAKVEAGRQ